MSEDKAIVEKFNESPAIESDKDLGRLIEENLGDEGINPSDLPRIKIPAGGTTSFEVPTLGGEEMQKEINGIILHKQTVRAFWSKDLDEAGESSPDCMSKDGKIGEVLNKEEFSHLGGLCSECPKNEWGSGKGKAKACTKKWQLYILRQDEMLPTILSLPPTSIKAVREYLLFIAGKGFNKFEVITNFELEKAKSGDGITYSKVKVGAVDPLDADFRDKIKTYRDDFVNSLQEIQAEDVTFDEKEINKDSS